MKITFEESIDGLEVYIQKTQSGTFIGLPIRSISELQEFIEEANKYIKGETIK